MAVSIEPRILQLLTLDPVCQGRVNAATVRALALEFAREPEPDRDVLAERAACLAGMRVHYDRLCVLSIDGTMELIVERRWLEEWIDAVELGLHRDLTKETNDAQG